MIGGIASMMPLKVRRTSRPRLVMATVRRSPHRSLVLLVANAGLMLATANTSANELGGTVGCAVSCGTNRDTCVALSAEGLVLDRCRTVTPLRPAAEGCSGRSVDPLAMTQAPGRRAAARRSDGVPDQVRDDRLGDGVRSDDRSTLPSHSHHRTVPKVVPLGDPSDDGTSDDTDDDDQTSKSFNDDDDSEVSIISILREKVPHLIIPDCAPLTGTSPPCSPFPAPKRLRC